MRPADVTSAPANPVVAYEYRELDESNVNAWAGKPRPELEDIWDDLMRGRPPDLPSSLDKLTGERTGEVFRATREDLEMSRGGVDDSIELEHGGYLATLSVYHELHCLEWIKRSYARVESLDQLHEKEDHLGKLSLYLFTTVVVADFRRPLSTGDSRSGHVPRGCEH